MSDMKKKVDKNANLELLKKIDAAFAEDPSETRRRMLEKKYQLRKENVPGN